jgi:hypothetical protein
MEPEISTRCLQCGAAVRPQTLFCPECGQPADKHAPGREHSGETDVSDAASESGDEIAPESAEHSLEAPPETAEPETTAVEEPEEAGTVDEAAAVEELPEGADTEKADDPLAEHLAKLKNASQAAPIVIVATPDRKSLRRKTSSGPAKRSKGKLIFSRFPSLRRVETARPGRIEPGLRFLIVAGVLVVFALVAYYFSRFLR